MLYFVHDKSVLITTKYAYWISPRFGLIHFFRSLNALFMLHLISSLVCSFTFILFDDLFSILIIFVYIFESIEFLLPFLSVENSIPILIELFGNHIVLATHITITIKVITDVRSPLCMALLCKFCLSLLLIISHVRAGPPFRDMIML